MQTIAPPKISTETIAAFFAAMRLWLLEAVAPFLLYLSDRTANGRDIRAWLDAEVRDAIDETKRMLFVIAVAHGAAKGRRNAARRRAAGDDAQRLSPRAAAQPQMVPADDPHAQSDGSRPTGTT